MVLVNHPIALVPLQVCMRPPLYQYSHPAITRGGGGVVSSKKSRQEKERV